MAKLFVQLLLPMGLAGSLACLLLWAAWPLLVRQRPALRRAALLACGVLFIAPLGLLLPAATPGAQPQAQAPAAVYITLQTAPPTAPVYRVGQALADAAAAEAAAPAAPQAQQSAGATENTQAATQPPAMTPEPGETPASAHAPGAGENSGGSMGSLFGAGFAALGAFIRQVGWASIFACLWLAGAAAVLGTGAIRYLLLMRRLGNSSAPVTDAGLLALYHDICRELGVRRPPRLMQSRQVGAPILAGLLRPAIVLPAVPGSVQQTGFALRHELTHHRHKDLPCKLLMQAVCLLHWYNPLGYALRRRFAAVCEEHCDAAVTKTMDGATRRAYAATLLQYAGPRQTYMVSAFASPVKGMKKRLAALLNPKRPGRAMRAVGLAATALVLCTGLLAGCALSAGAGSGASISEDLPPDGSSVPEEFPFGESPFSEHTRIAVGAANDPPKGMYLYTASNGETYYFQDHGFGVLATPGKEAFIEPGPNSNLPAKPGLLACPVPDAITTGISRYNANLLEVVAPAGSPIYSPFDGKVLLAEESTTNGLFLLLEHEDSMATQVAFMDCGKLAVRAGDSVRQNQQVGVMDEDPADPRGATLKAHFSKQAPTMHTFQLPPEGFGSPDYEFNADDFTFDAPFYKGIFPLLHTPQVDEFLIEYGIMVPFDPLADVTWPDSTYVMGSIMQVPVAASYPDYTGPYTNEEHGTVCPVPDALSYGVLRPSENNSAISEYSLVLRTSGATPIYSASAGTFAGTRIDEDGLGLQVFINGDDGRLYSYNSCLAAVDFAEGDPVRKGQQIALSGSSGYIWYDRCLIRVYESPNGSSIGPDDLESANSINPLDIIPIPWTHPDYDPDSIPIYVDRNGDGTPESRQG